MRGNTPKAVLYPKTYIVRIYTNLQQVYEYRSVAYTGVEAKMRAFKLFKDSCLTDERATNAEVFDLNIREYC